MKAITFYKFIKENDIEYHFEMNENNEKDILFFIPFNKIEEFTNLLRYSVLSDNIINVVLKNNNIVIFGSEFLDFYGIFEEIYNKLLI